MELTVKSYPKVNIGLYVSKKREDGYHNLISIFQRVYCIYDEITVKLDSSNKNSISVKGLEEYIEEEKSTVYKASLLWLEKQKECFSININIEKNVPVRSGLGSPSSNAASVLMALNDLSGSKMKIEELCKLGEQIGSDVPFFFSLEDAAIVTSRGDVVKPIKARKDIEFVLIKGLDEKPSTKEAYRRLDERTKIEDLPSEDSLLSMYYQDIDKWNFKNDFELICRKPKDKEKIYLTGSGNYWYTVRMR